MKFFGKFFIVLLLLLMLLLVALYGLVQTRWGSEQVSSWISNCIEYDLSVAKIDHSFSRPLNLVLHEVTFGKDGQPAVLVAKRVDLGFSGTQFSNAGKFASIALSGGSLNISDKSVNWPIQAKRLLLNDMDINNPHSAFRFRATGVNGSLTPWQPVTGNMLGNLASFQLTAEAININQFSSDKTHLEGRLQEQHLILSKIDARLARGRVKGQAERDANGNWLIDKINVDNIRLQSQHTLADFLQPVLRIPSVWFKQIQVNHVHLQGAHWAVADLSLTLNDVKLCQNNWESNNGSLTMQASSAIYGQLALKEPMINASFSPQKMTFSNISTHWINGLISANGTWLKRSNRLMLDNLNVSRLELTLPDDWRERWMQPLPTWLDSVVLHRFTAQRNLIIDINPAFPFQITALNSNGSNLLLARDHQWGIWSGELNADAAEATFNRIDINHPVLALTSDDQHINLTKASASVGVGSLNASATVSQQPERALSLIINGHAVPLSLLAGWGWPGEPMQGNGNIKLNMGASLAADRPLRQSVSATLSVNNGNHQIEQKMVAGELRP